METIIYMLLQLLKEVVYAGLESIFLYEPFYTQGTNLPNITRIIAEIVCVGSIIWAIKTRMQNLFMRKPYILIIQYFLQIMY